MAFKTTLPKILQGGNLYNIADLLGQEIVSNIDTKILAYPTDASKVYVIPDLNNVPANTSIYSTFDNTSIYEPGATYPAAKNIKANKQLGIFKSLKSGGGAYFTRGNKLFYINSVDNTNFYLSTKAYKKVKNLISTVKKGQPIGELWSWTRGLKQTYDPATGKYTALPTNDFYLVFKINNKAAFVKVTSDLIDTKTLAQQDIKTTEEQSQSIGEKIEKYIKILFIGGAVVLVVTQLGKAAIYSQAQKTH